MQTKTTEPPQNSLWQWNCILRASLGSTFTFISDFVSNSSGSLKLSSTSLIQCPYLVGTSLSVSLHCTHHWDNKKRSCYNSHQPSHFLPRNIVVNSLQSPSVPLILRNYCWEIEIIMFSSSNPDVVSISWQLFLSNVSQGSETLVPGEGFPFLKSINSNCQSCK